MALSSGSRFVNLKDYCATPNQFTHKPASAKITQSAYTALCILGFNPDHMRIVVLQDLNLKSPHAVLIVYLNGQPLILDNPIKQVVHASRIRHYKPIYSINQKNWWLYRS